MKRLILVLLSTVLIFTSIFVLPVSSYAQINATYINSNDLKTGDTVKFGLYPQSKVTNKTTISNLNKIKCSMKSYGYIQNCDSSGKYDTLNMSYADIEYNGYLYRKVYIGQYRPQITSANEEYFKGYIEQEKNGYTKGKSYYFKWEPIVWQVLGKQDGGISLMSKRILDSQCYSDVDERPNWKSSSIRQWLNSSFYDTAFSSTEKQRLQSANHTYEGENATTKSTNYVTDKVWLLNVAESKSTSLGFTKDSNEYNKSKQAIGTEYAKSQGLYKSNESACNNCSYWWLSNSHSGAHDATYITLRGISWELYDEDPINVTNVGVRPVIKLKASKKIYSFSTNLSATNYQFNGKNRKPFVTVRNSNGKKLTKNTDYTVTYQKDCKNVGTYKVVIKLKGSYSGTITQYYVIKPKSTTITNLTSIKNGFKVEWNKQTVQTTGYQIRYSQNSSMSNSKTIDINKNKSTRKTIDNLNSGKKYYVQIRTFKTVNGTKYYSSWSAKKYVTTKK